MEESRAAGRAREAGRQSGDGDVCIVCWQTPADRAHLIDRSLAPDPGSDPLRVVRLCRAHHDAYDNHTLDLLPFLAKCFRPELARAVEVFGLIGTLERVTGRAWAPTPTLPRVLARPVTPTDDRTGDAEVLAPEERAHA